MLMYEIPKKYVFCLKKIGYSIQDFGIENTDHSLEN